MTTTHTDPTAAALLRAILLHPADDVARLVFADWLDEHAGVPRECPRASTYNPFGPACKVCGGGYKNLPHNPIAGNGFAERAEFIRVQVRMEQLRASAVPLSDTARWNQHSRDALAEMELLTDARRSEWFGIPCPVCEGAGVAEHTADGWSSLESCDHCTGTGLAPVEFRRGFVEIVRCRRGDVLRWSNSEAWALTPWAAGVLAAHPVTRWEIADIADAEPWANYAGTHWGWWSENSHTVADASTLPHVVMAALADDSRRRDSNISLRYTAAKAVPNGCVLFATEAEARDALALAVGRVARRLAGLPDSGTNAV